MHKPKQPIAHAFIDLETLWDHAQKFPIQEGLRSVFHPSALKTRQLIWESPLSQSQTLSGTEPVPFGFGFEEDFIYKFNESFSFNNFCKDFLYTSLILFSIF